jgi:hypothetical protein
MSDPHARMLITKQRILQKVERMFIYLITLNSGQIVRVESAGDPTDHPTFFGRVVDVQTLGESGKLLSLV